MSTLYWKEGLLLLMGMCALAAPIVAQSHQDSFHTREEQSQRAAMAREFYEEHGWAYGVRFTQGSTGSSETKVSVYSQAILIDALSFGETSLNYSYSKSGKIRRFDS